MFTDDDGFDCWVVDGTAGVECRGLRWETTGWLDGPEISREVDEVRFAGPSAGDPGVWLELRHTFDRTWQIRLSASSGDWADWPGAHIDLAHTDAVQHSGLIEQTEPGVAVPPPAPVWTWHLGAEGWLMVADHYDQQVLFGSLRRGVAVDTDRGVQVPPARLQPGATHVTAWTVQELGGVAEAQGLLPSWLPPVTGVAASGEIGVNAPDHGLTRGSVGDIVVDEEDGVTLLSSTEPHGAIHEVLLHGPRGTVTLPLAFGRHPHDLVPDWARAIVETHPDGEELAAEDAVILSTGASAGVADAGDVLERLPIRTTSAAEQPLVVGACAMELARTGDPAWANRLADAVQHLTPVPGAVSALVRAVVGVFAVDGDPQPYLDRIADLELTAMNPPRTAQDAILALEVAAVGGWVHDDLVERVAGLLGWGMPLSTVLPVDPRTATQAIAAMSLVDERIVPHWNSSPSAITTQASRWVMAQYLAGVDHPMELAAWLLLPVTQ